MVLLILLSERSRESDEAREAGAGVGGPVGAMIGAALVGGLLGGLFWFA